MVRDWLLKIASQEDLRGEDYRVLLFLLSRAESQEVQIAQTEIARSLSIKSSQVCRAIKRLETLKLIRKKIIAGKLIGYCFSVE